MLNTVKLRESNIFDLVIMSITALKKPESFIMIPTETVYGLACLWDDKAARENIYKAKGRDTNKPFQMLAFDMEMVKKYGGIISFSVEQIVKTFCPGPLTLIVPSHSGQKIGFRIPSHQFTLELIKRLGEPLAATSANASGEPPALIPECIAGKLKIQPVIIIDGGPLPEKSRASTVAEITGNEIKIIREGIITLSDLQKAVLKID